MTIPLIRSSNSFTRSREDLTAAHCWFGVDVVPGDAASTSWRRSNRLAQARWRETHGWPIGHQPYEGRPNATPVGSRMDLAFARETGSNFLSERTLAAARYRLANPEPHQVLDERRLFADLLSSMPLCFNLFGECWRDPHAAGEAVRTWWPELASESVELWFEHSPGRRDSAYLGNGSAFDACFLLGAEPHTVIGVETKYHELPKRDAAPTGTKRSRYLEITERAGLFAPGWEAQVLGTELQQIWLDHLLLLSMLQHPSRRWTRGLFVLVHPAYNTPYAHVAERYAALLRDGTTYCARTLESLIEGVPASVRDAFTRRYLAG